MLLQNTKMNHALREPSMQMRTWGKFQNVNLLIFYGLSMFILVLTNLYYSLIMFVLNSILINGLPPLIIIIIISKSLKVLDSLLILNDIEGK